MAVLGGIISAPEVGNVPATVTGGPEAVACNGPVESVAVEEPKAAPTFRVYTIPGVAMSGNVAVRELPEASAKAVRSIDNLYPLPVCKEGTVAVTVLPLTERVLSCTSLSATLLESVIP
jgi:hypothetical protein